MTPEIREELTARVLKAVHPMIRNPMYPTVHREVWQAMGKRVTGSQIDDHIDEMIRDGRLIYRTGRFQRLRATPPEQAACRSRTLEESVAVAQACHARAQREAA